MGNFIMVGSEWQQLTTLNQLTSQKSKQTFWHLMEVSNIPINFSCQKNKKKYNQTSISMDQDTENLVNGKTQNNNMGMQSAKLNPENFKGLLKLQEKIK